MLIVRDAVILDLFDILDGAEKFYQETTVPRKLNFSIQTLADNLTKLIPDKAFSTIVAYDGTELVGFLVGYVISDIWTNDCIGYIQLIYVSPNKRNYVTASKLLREFEARCKEENNVKGFQIGLHSGINNNLTAIAFFERKGYAKSGINLMKFEVQ